MKRFIILLILLVLLTFGILLAFTGLFGGPYLKLPAISLVKEQTIQSHEGILREIRELSELQTVEYIVKTVFPHDYFIPGTSFEQLLEKSARGGPLISDALNAQEYVHYQAYRLARDAGMYPESAGFDFVVVTARVELGYRLADLDADEIIQINTDGDDTTALISLPPAQILNIRIEDPDSSNYSYPDLFLDQQNWGRIAAFVQEHIIALDELEQARIAARTNFMQFFSTFLNDGWGSQVIIPVEFATIE